MFQDQLIAEIKGENLLQRCYVRLRKLLVIAPNLALNEGSDKSREFPSRLGSVE